MNRKTQIMMKLTLLFLISLFGLLLIPAPASAAVISPSFSPSPSPSPSPSLTLLQSPTSGIPEVYIELIETNLTAEVGPGDSCEVVFNGEVTVSLNPYTSVIVTLTADDTWGSAVVNPGELLFNQSGEESFTVKVRARPRESYQNTGTVSVTGMWAMYPGGLQGNANPPQGAVGRIDIAQYFKFSLGYENITNKVMPGGEIQCGLNINNEGNFIDTFELELVNEDDLTSRGIKLTLSSSTVEVQERGILTVPIEVSVPKDNNNLGSYELRVKVWSIKGQEDGIPPQEVSFKIKVTNDPETGLGDPGEGSGDSTTDQKDSGLDWGMFSTNVGIIFVIIIVVVIISLILIIKRLVYRSRKRSKMHIK